MEEGQGAGGARRWRRRGPAAHRGGGPAAARRWRRGWRRLDVVVAAGDGGQHGTATRRGGAARRDGEDGEATRRHGEEQHGEEGHGEHWQHLACVRRRQGARRRSSSICQSWATKRPSPALKQAFGTGWSHQPVPKGYWYRLVAPTGSKGLFRGHVQGLWYRLVAPTGTKGVFMFVFLSFSFPVLLKKL